MCFTVCVLEGSEPGKQKRGRPRQRSVEDVVAAAIRVLDRAGVDAVGIRSVAQELGVHPTTLYTYVENRDELLGMVRQELVAQIVSDVGEVSANRKTVIRFFAALQTAVQRHPSLLRLVFESDDLFEATLPGVDAVVRYFMSRGLTPRAAGRAYRTLYLYTIGLGWFDHNVSSRSIAARRRRLRQRLGQPDLRPYAAARLAYEIPAETDLDVERQLATVIDALVRAEVGR